ncbi:MAG TPA: M15 family metallopeptidase, partial [Candidatus Obscuribacterales bacterium]
WLLVGFLSAIAGLVVSWLTYQEAETALPVPFQPMMQVSEGRAGAATLEGTERRSLLGHFAYPEATESDLVAIAADRTIRLRPAAATQLDAMVTAAAAEGVYLLPISGFRSVDEQKYLFFDVKAERAQTPKTRAEVSAPPGYSEHHTGYAIDLGDADAPATDLSLTFEDTAAFTWLAANAPRYSFELSFPEGNEQGVQYEPWHWRYVGDSDSLETFYQDR